MLNHKFHLGFERKVNQLSADSMAERSTVPGGRFVKLNEAGGNL